MKNNLLFFGIKESCDPTFSENSEVILREFLTQYVENDPTVNRQTNVKDDLLKFEEVFRLRGPHRGTENRRDKPRPILAKFTNYRDREIIREAGVNLNIKKSGKYINQQYPPEMEERRRQLFPIYRKLKNYPLNTQKCTLVCDKLYVGNELYNLNSGSLEPCPNNTKSRPTYNDSRQSSRSRTVFNSNNRKPNQSKVHQLNFTTPNRFTPLRDIRTDEQNNKLLRSPRSPLEETELKRPRDETVPKTLTDSVDGPHIEHSQLQSNEYTAVNLIDELPEDHELHGNLTVNSQ
jgi:hypothetical protein